MIRPTNSIKNDKRFKSWNILCYPALHRFIFIMYLFAVSDSDGGDSSNLLSVATAGNSRMMQRRATLMRGYRCDRLCPFHSGIYLVNSVKHFHSLTNILYFFCDRQIC